MIETLVEEGPDKILPTPVEGRKNLLGGSGG